MSRDSEGLYRGVWRWDEGRNVAVGNPASSSDVQDTMRAVKKKDGAEGIRTHSGAMSLEYMDRIFDWSKREGPVTAKIPPATLLTMAERHHLYKHLGWRAFSSIGWTVWTRLFLRLIVWSGKLSCSIYRNFETLKLQRKHLTLDCVSEDEYKIPHWRVALEQRKNWQNKLSNETDLRGSISGAHCLHALIYDT